MEYLLGCIITLITMFITVKLVRNPKNSFQAKNPIFAQSRKFELVKKYYINKQEKALDKQSVKHSLKKYVKTIFIGDTAYWIENNLLHEAKHISGTILSETKKPVDIMAMDKVELNRMMFVVDKLAEGKDNDSGNSGHEEF